MSSDNEESIEEENPSISNSINSENNKESENELGVDNEENKELGESESNEQLTENNDIKSNQSGDENDTNNSADDKSNNSNVDNDIESKCSDNIIPDEGIERASTGTRSSSASTASNSESKTMQRPKSARRKNLKVSINSPLGSFDDLHDFDENLDFSTHYNQNKDSGNFILISRGISAGRRFSKSRPSTAGPRLGLEVEGYTPESLYNNSLLSSSNRSLNNAIRFKEENSNNEGNT